MSYLVWLLIGAVVVYYIISRSKQTHTKSSQRNKPVSSPASHLVAENEDGFYPVSTDGLIKAENS